MGLLIGLLLAALTGIYHHTGLRLLDRLTGKDKRQPNVTVMAIFIGLLVLHTSEIFGWAYAYSALHNHGALGDLSGNFDGSWQDYVYYSGINYITVGYTQIESSGDLRLVSMMEALLGFMIITWSATFIYSAWQKAFR
jgi:hypothetical protein